MGKSFSFEGLYVLDLANNHQGDIAHGQRIVREVGEVVRKHAVRAALKFQFRDLDTFIHTDHIEKSENKHISRFQSTRLSMDDYGELAGDVRSSGMITMSTPFDEASVDAIEELEIELIKVASCSANDWPLLERVLTCNKPVVVSTGGLQMSQIDNIVSFLQHRRVHFALMHCVAVYPTPPDLLALNQIQALRERYPDFVVGFSTHEQPDDTRPVLVAVAKGAQMLERHVGIATDSYPLNAYSSEPGVLCKWIESSCVAREMCGPLERSGAVKEEMESLRALARGIYVQRQVEAGAELTPDDVYFAMPLEDGQLAASDWRSSWRKPLRAKANLGKDAPLLWDDTEVPSEPDRHIFLTAIHTIKGMLNEARIALPTEFRLEFSHHHGVPAFSRIGATIIDCVNRDYCKKLIIQFPGQSHPAHYHKRKDETFHVLFGKLEMEIEGRRRQLDAGDLQIIQQGVWHEFWTESGVIFEEISTTSYADDSFYEDKEINEMPRDARKTVVENWGRYQV